jgi:hypothetical protein
MRYLATGTITLPVMASFEDDGTPLDVQAKEALQTEVIAEFCLPWEQEHPVEGVQVSPVGE